MLKYDKALSLLQEKGYTTYRIRKEKILTESALQSMRHGKNINTINIDRLCALLGCQPGDLLEYVPDNEQDNN